MRIALLHGFAGDPHSWDDVIAAWPGRDDFDAIALPGHGSPILDTWDANLAAIDVSGAEVVIGYSLGARVALGLVAANRIARAILVGVNPGLPAHDLAARRARREVDAVWAKLLRTEGVERFLAAWEAQPLFATQHRVPSARLAARRARRLALDPEQLARSLETMGLAEMPDYSSTSLANVVLVAGAEDTKFIAIAHALAAPLHLIADSGHDPTLEQPEALAHALHGILAE